MYNPLHHNEALQQRIARDRKIQLEHEADTARMLQEIKDGKTKHEKTRVHVMLSLLTGAR